MPHTVGMNIVWDACVKAHYCLVFQINTIVLGEPTANQRASVRSQHKKV